MHRTHSPVASRALVGGGALVAAVLFACSAPSAPLAQCESEARACGATPEFELSCEDGFWVPALCGEGERCIDDRCASYQCLAGETECRGNAVATCVDESWGEPLPCDDSYQCDEGECLPVVCNPDSGRCGENGSVEKCNATGTRWMPWTTCTDAQICLEGACLPKTCAEGNRACGPKSRLFTCDAEEGWVASICEGGLPCVFGRCLECLSDETCDPGERCDEGACVETTPAWITTSVPAGTVGVAYSETLIVEGGLAPILITLTEGTLPDGLTISSRGTLAGTPTTAGLFSFTVSATDARQASAELELTLEVLAQGALRVTTTQLPAADLDYSYSYQLQGAGGIPPLAWQALQPLPAGLSLTSGGLIHGTPTELGEFPLTFRVLDVRTPPGYDAKDFVLQVRIAPLEIIGDQTMDLFVIKIITLPLLVPYLPYSQQLQARGGLRPYEWSETSAPPGTGFLIPKWGLPQGLTLGAGGRITGSVTDLSDATRVSIPFTGIDLTGYFISAKVEDSQQNPDSDTAVFFIPTVPL